MLIENRCFTRQYKPIQSPLNYAIDPEPPYALCPNLDKDVIAAARVTRRLLRQHKARLFLAEYLAYCPVVRMTAEGLVHLTNDADKLSICVVIDFHLLQNGVAEPNDELLKRKIRLAQDSDLHDLLLSGFKLWLH